MTMVTEYVVFGILMAFNLGLGVYFSRRRIQHSGTAEVFLGSRSLRALPLAVSMVATMLSSTGLVGFTGHFYAYGFHQAWNDVAIVVVAPLVAHLFLPVLYELRITSVFQYIRLRFNPVISLTACASYLFLTQSIGALSIFAASLTVVTVFGVPLVWCNIMIGFCGTFYTAMGGLRGVVWTDCVQLVFMLLAPATVIVKVFLDLNNSNSTAQPLSDFDVRPYMGNFALDLTQDENVWAPLLAASTANMYRFGLDQAVVQRCMATRTLRSAQRTLITGSLLNIAVDFINVAMAVALVLWYRGCDPQLAGAIKTHDQISPFYVKNHFAQFPGFTGVFMVAVVSSATSTISSIINSQAAVLYVDVLSQHFKNLDSHIHWITRGLAFLLGGFMVAYSCACPYMGSVTRGIVMAYCAATGPFVGLLILAVMFPFVHSKGAGISTLVFLALQFVVMWLVIGSGVKPPHMPVSLDYCPLNSTFQHYSVNNTTSFLARGPPSKAAFFLPSPMWSCLFSTCATVFLGVVISILTGEQRQPKAQTIYLNRWFLRWWKRLGIMESGERIQVSNDNTCNTKALLSSKHWSKLEDAADSYVIDLSHGHTTHVVKKSSQCQSNNYRETSRV